MTDRDFDRMLSEQLAHQPVPESAVRRVTPWSTAIGYLTWGLILTTLHLDFLYLQYLLPTVGFALLVLGLRSLRRENRMFFAGWVFSLAQAVWYLATLLLDVTALPLPIGATAIGLIVTGADLLQLLLVRQGLKQVFARSGQTMPSDPLLRVIVWQLIAVGLALSPLAHSWLAFIPMLIFYIVAVRALYSLGTLLDTCGYGIRAARVRLSPQALGLGYFGLALAIVIAGSLAANHPIYDFSAQTAAGLPEVRTQLTRLGLPEGIAQDLPDETVQTLQETVCIQSDTETLLIDPRNQTVLEYGADGSQFYTNQQTSSGKVLEAATSYLIQPDGSVYLLYYARWTEGHPWWEDGVLLHTEQGDTHAALVSGSAIYDRDGVRYAGPLRRMRQEPVTSYGFFGASTYEAISAAACFPLSAESPRLYLLCRFPPQQSEPLYILWTTANYRHTTAPFRLPFGHAEDPATHRRIESVQQYTTCDPVSPIP